MKKVLTNLHKPTPKPKTLIELYLHKLHKYLFEAHFLLGKHGQSWLEKHAYTPDILAKLKKRTNIYNSLHFPAVTNISGSKTSMTFNLFYANYDYRSYDLKTLLP